MTATTRGRGLAAGIAVAALSAGVLAAPALAGPDDGKFVATQRHVDSPKVFWGEDGFELRSEAGRETRPIEETVNWLSKGQPGAKASYIGKVDDDPRQSFLGKPGDLIWDAPAYWSSGESIWSGFGADTNIPADGFKDGSFTLDLVGFDGPGRVDYHTATDEDFPVTRLLSSHEPGLRSAWIKPGTHTHNRTSFSKPGRYELQFRASTRDKDGNFVASEPQTLVWQVGGTAPKEDGIGDVRAAFDKAPAEGEAKPTLTIGKHDKNGSKIPGAQHLNELRLDTGNKKDTGTAVFFIDGYYLAEVPVEGGKAVHPEFLGSQAADYQAVFIPADGAESPRFVTEPLSFTRGDDEASTQKTAGEYPTPATKDPAPEFRDEDVEVSDRGVTLEVKHQGDGEVAIEATPDDERLTFQVMGTLDGDCYQDVQFTSSEGMRSQVEHEAECREPEEIKSADLTLIPDSRANVGAITLSGQELAANKPLHLEFPEAPFVPREGGDAKPPAKPGPSDKPDPSGKPDPSTKPDPSEKPDPTPPVEPNPQPPAESGDVKVCRPTALDATPVAIDAGHVDLGPVETDAGLELAVGDDTGQHAKERVDRLPEAATLVVDKKMRRPVRERELEAAPFLKDAGDEIYHLDQTQHGNQLWPGFSTEHAPGDANYAVELEPVSAPEGAKWWAYTLNPIDRSHEMLASSEGASRIERPERFHLHNSWSFSKPGTYAIKVRAVEVGNDDNATDWATVTFEVAPDGEVTPPAGENCDGEGGQPTPPGGSQEPPTGQTDPEGPTDGSGSDEVPPADPPSKDVEPGAQPEDKGDPDNPTEDGDRPAGEKGDEHKPEGEGQNPGAQPGAGSHAAPGQNAAPQPVAAGHQAEAQGGSLARTGANVATIGAIALALLALGGAAVFFGRRRKGDQSQES